MKKQEYLYDGTTRQQRFMLLPRDGGDIVCVAESEQAAQVGHRCYYDSQSGFVGVTEGKERSKGLASLSECCEEESVAYSSRHYTQGSVSDSSTQGGCRVPNEIVNL